MTEQTAARNRRGSRTRGGPAMTEQTAARNRRSGRSRPAMTDPTASGKTSPP